MLMALPSFSAVWSSRCADEEKSAQSKDFFLFGSSRTPEEKSAVPTFRANPSFRWFSDGSMSSNLSCCERSFTSDEQLERHRKEHVKCFTKDCEFEAHPDVVEKHFELQHRNSLYKKLCLTNKPEDIEKWISERKKNFPTKERIVAKKEAEDKRRDRGEVIERKNFGLMRRGRGRGGTPFSKDGAFRGRGGAFRGRGGTPFTKDGAFRGRGGGFRGRGRGVLGHERPLRGRGRARGLPVRRAADLEGLAYARPGEDPLACLPDFGDGEEKMEEIEKKKEEEEDDRPVEMSSKVAPVVSGPALSLIANCYDSSEEEEEKEAEAEKPASRKKEEEKMDIETAPAAEDPRPPPPPPSAELRGNDPVLRLVRRRERCMEDRRRLLTRPRLLEMLLARDIQHERNVLMQCCYFINARNFFGRCKKFAEKEKEEKTEKTPSTVIAAPLDDEVWEGDEVL